MGEVNNIQDIESNEDTEKKKAICTERNSGTNLSVGVPACLGVRGQRAQEGEEGGIGVGETVREVTHVLSVGKLLGGRIKKIER